MDLYFFSSQKKAFFFKNALLFYSKVFTFLLSLTVIYFTFQRAYTFACVCKTGIHFMKYYLPLFIAYEYYLRFLFFKSGYHLLNLFYNSVMGHCLQFEELWPQTLFDIPNVSVFCLIDAYFLTFTNSLL